MIKVVCETENSLFDEIAAAAYDALGLSGEAAVEFEAVSGEEIRGLNQAYRGVDSVTDVLSFPLLESIEPFDEAHYPLDYDSAYGAVLLGSIVMCTERAAEQAAEFGHSVRREEGYLFLHGLLHLLGYDHIEEDDRRVMREAEERILAALGLERV